MARSEAFDEYEDVGQAFSQEAVDKFDPRKVAEEHLAWMTEEVRVLLRAGTLEKEGKVSNAKFQTKAENILMGRLTWMAVAAQLPEVDTEAVRTLPSAQSKEGKALTVKAVNMDSKWAEACRARCYVDVRQYVTLSRRAAGAQSWRKPEHSLSNKIANALAGDMRTFNKIDEWLQPESPSE